MDPRSVVDVLALSVAVIIAALCRRRAQHAAAEIDALCRQLRAASPHQQRDALTNLLHRRAFHELGSGYLEDHPDQPLVAIAVDLDSFWRVNDTYGYPAGDTVLGIIAGRIVDYIASPLVARLGSNTFVALAPVRDDADESPHPNSQVLAGILGTPVWAAGHWITVTASVAEARVSHPADVDAILRRVEASLRRARTITALSDNRQSDR
jgi:diguanylate cyclase (GGDEF)-like protein